mgnify:CR=1 FL=1
METKPIHEALNTTYKLSEEALDNITNSDDLQKAESEKLNNEQTDTSSKPQQQNNSSKEDTKATEQQSPSKESGEEKKRVLTTKAGWKNPLAYTHAPLIGAADWSIGLVNKIPGVDVPEIPRYQSESLQITRDLGSLVIPNILLFRFLRGKAVAANTKIGWSLGKSKPFQMFAETGLAAGTGAIVDEIAPVQEKDHNLTGQLQKLWPNRMGWLPDNLATLDNDSPDIKRQKNRNEGILLNLGTETIIATGKLMRNLRGVKKATKWVPENEMARNWEKKIEDKPTLSKDPVENEVLINLKKQSDEFDALGKANLEEKGIPDPWTADEPVLGVHNVYGPLESGIRTTDDGGIVSAAVDAYKVANNIDTIDGRLGSVITEAALTKGLKPDKQGRDLINKLAKELQETEVGFKDSKNIPHTHKQIMLEGDKIAADLMGMEVDKMKKYLEPFSGIDVGTKAKILDDKGYAGVFKSIKKYLDIHSSLSLARARGVVSTSLAGQVADLAEGARLMENTPAVERAQEMIINRLRYLMKIKGQTAYASGRSLNMKNLWNRLTRKKSTMTVQDAFDAIKAEKGSLDEALAKLDAETNLTLDTLQAVSKERPQLLKPLALAYELTDGKVSTIGSLNEYIKNTTGVFKKAIVDGNPDMPSAWTQGLWANIYNSALSAIGTPLRAGFANMAAMVEKPIAISFGALRYGDKATLERASWMYQVGIVDTLQKSFSHMKQVFKKAANDPSSVAYIMRDDIARKNEDTIEVLREFANAKELEGEFGPTAIVNQIELMNELSEHPWLRFGANAMTAFDGFTRAFIGAVEARGVAYDNLLKEGRKIDADSISSASKMVYESMFDSNGFITDSAVEHASREIAMNLNSPLSTGVTSLINHVPAIKPWLMFPKTSINMLQYTGTHTPFIDKFVKELDEFRLPFEEMDGSKVKSLLANRGIDPEVIAGNPAAVYNTIRAELKGRRAIGALAVMGVVGLFSQGRIRGNGSYDKEVQNVRNDLNIGKNEIQGFDGNWYSYAGIPGISDWMSITTDILENWDTLDDQDQNALLAKAGFLLSANLSNKSFLANLEPLFDMLSGNSAAVNRFGASFGSTLFPGSGFRSEQARLWHGFKEYDQELYSLLANRNPIAKGTLATKKSWYDGKEVGMPSNPLVHMWNTFTPIGKVRENVGKGEKFLSDIEFDVRPYMKTNGKGIRYSPDQRAAVFEKIGEMGYFRNEVEQIMKKVSAKEFRQLYRNQQRESSLPVDRKETANVFRALSKALLDAKRLAEGSLSDEMKLDIKIKQYKELESKRAQQLNDLETLLKLENK